MKNTNALKHKELYERYQQQPEPKAKRSYFSSRVLRYWYSKEKAIKDKSYLSESRLERYWSVIKENWRICRKCWVFKERKDFSKDRASNYWYSSTCKECRNKAKAEYRERTNRRTDRLYKENRRHLKEWEQIYFQDDIREVISYKFKKWYTVKSILNWTERIIDTNDNHNALNNHCVRFRKMKSLLKVKTIEQLEQERMEQEERAVNESLFD